MGGGAQGLEHQLWVIKRRNGALLLITALVNQNMTAALDSLIDEVPIGGFKALLAQQKQLEEDRTRRGQRSFLRDMRTIRIIEVLRAQAGSCPWLAGGATLAIPTAV
jgi:hypothetical protein